MLHGFPSHQTDAMPTWGAFFIMSSFGTPAAYSMAYTVPVSRALWGHGRRQAIPRPGAAPRGGPACVGSWRPAQAGRSGGGETRGTDLGTGKVMLACHGVRPAVEGTAGGQGLELDVVVVLGLVAVLGRGVGAGTGLIPVGFHFERDFWMAVLVTWWKKNDDAKGWTSWWLEGSRSWKDGEGGTPEGGEGGPSGG